MRNILIASIVVVITTPVILIQNARLVETRGQAAGLLAQLSRTEQAILQKQETLRKIQDECNEAKRILEEEDASRPGAMAEAEVVTPFDPNTEGYWPAAQPYFYLAKKHIRALDYRAMNGTGRVTSEAAALFGMTREERRAIDAAYEMMLAQIREREIRNAYPTNTPPEVEAQRTGNMTSVFLPADPDLEMLEAELAHQVSQTLGEERAGLFLEKAGEALKALQSFSDKDRTLTFIPQDEITGEIIVTRRSPGGGWGASFYRYDMTTPLDPIFFQHAHLMTHLLQRY